MVPVSVRSPFTFVLHVLHGCLAVSVQVTVVSGEEQCSQAGSGEGREKADLEDGERDVRNLADALAVLFRIDTWRVFVWVFFGGGGGSCLMENVSLSV